MVSFIKWYLISVVITVITLKCEIGLKIHLFSKYVIMEIAITPNMIANIIKHIAKVGLL